MIGDTPRMARYGIFWKISLDYVMSALLATAVPRFCRDAYDTRMSHELLFTGLASGEGQALLDGITKVRVRISDEAEGGFPR